MSHGVEGALHCCLTLALLGVAALALPGMLFEVDAIALRR